MGGRGLCHPPDLGQLLGPAWDAADFGADQDWERHSAAIDELAELYTVWNAAVTRCRAALAAALADGGLERPAGFSWSDGRPRRCDGCSSTSSRSTHATLVNAELLREAVDGRVGEDAPNSW